MKDTKPKPLSMDQMLTDPKLKPVPKPKPPPQRPRRRNAGFGNSGMSAEDILGYTPGDRD